MFIRYWKILGKESNYVVKKSVFFIFIAVFLQSIIFSVEKEKYMNNSYYKPLVEKIETSLLSLDNVSKVNVYKTSNPFPFVPDLFYIEVLTLNGHTYILEAIPVDLTFYKRSSRIRRIDGIEYVTINKILWTKSSDRGIVLSKIWGIKNIQVKTLKDFFENEEILYEYFTQPLDDIQHEKKPSIIFHKIKQNEMYLLGFLYK